MDYSEMAELQRSLSEEQLEAALKTALESYARLLARDLTTPIEHRDLQEQLLKIMMIRIRLAELRYTRLEAQLKQLAAQVTSRAAAQS
jgi:hypothetical protein